MLLKDCATTQAIRLVSPLVIALALCLMPNSVVVSSVTQGRRRVQRSQKPPIDYSQFSHSTHVTKEKPACDSCHKFPTKNWNEVRKGDTAFPDVAEFPEHTSCLDCHRQQFFARERPAPRICSNCHVNVTPRDTARFLFPSLGDISDSSRTRRDRPAEFTVNFSHEKHVDVVGLNLPVAKPRYRFVTVSSQQKAVPAESSEPKSCPVCHQTYEPQGNSDEEYVTKPPKNLGDNFWLKKGTFKTIPNSHTACFTCHNVEAELAPAPSDCNACHKLAMTPAVLLNIDFYPKLAETIGVADKTILLAWRRRISAGAFRHEGGEHPNINCVNCHNVSTMNTTEMKSMLVSVRTCGGAEGCHITATSDDGGILNYEIEQKKVSASFVCTKCHVIFGKEAIPQSHLNAVPKAKK